MWRSTYVAALFAMFMVFSQTASAEVQIDTRGLTDAQKAELVKQAEAMKSTIAQEETTEKIDKWVNVGERIGKMMGGAAKEVGIAVNDFVKTPVGQMTAALIIWNYIGSALVHVIAGFALLGLTVIGTRFAYHVLSAPTIEYDPENRDWRGRPRIKSYKPHALGDGETFMMWIGGMAGVGLSVFVMFSW